MQANWENFFSILLKNHPVLKELPEIEGSVDKITVRETGQLLVYCSLPEPFNPTLLCRLEQALEESLDIREAVICQKLSVDPDQIQASEYISKMVPWIIRHLWHQDAFLASMLSQSEFRPSANQVQIHLSDSCCTMLDDKNLSKLIGLCENYQNLRADFCLVPAKYDLGEQTRVFNTSFNQLANKVHINSLQSGGRPVTAENNSPVPPPAPAATKAKAENTSPRQFRRKPKNENTIWGRFNNELKPTQIRQLNSESGTVVFEGSTFGLETRSVSQGTRLLVKFAITDQTSSIQCVVFAKPEEEAMLGKYLSDGYVRVQAEISFDSQYAKDLQARVIGLEQAAARPGRSDQSTRKRAELHSHTKMSTKDAVCDAADLVRLAAAFEHPAIAITDHGVVQSFPEACNVQQALKKKGKDIKVIYGLEGYLVDDGESVCWGLEDYPEEFDCFVSLDVETTGLNPSSDRIIEVAAVRYSKADTGEWRAADRYVTFVNPGLEIPAKITEITGITTDMISQAPDNFTVMTRLNEFIGSSPVVAHNAFFDLGFLRYEGFRTPAENDPRIKFNMPLIDTLALARIFLPELHNHKLNTVAEKMGVKLGRHHRAEDDALACGDILLAIMKMTGCANMHELNRRAGHQETEAVLAHKKQVYHIILLAGDYLGLYNLYRLVSASHTSYFHSRPRIPRALLQFFRHGLIVGGACESGEIYQSVLELYRQSGSDYRQALKQLHSVEMTKLARFYDYLEIQPISNNRFYLREADSGLHSDDDLRNINRLIIDLGKNHRKPVCATCDVHFLEERDSEYRRILMTDMGYEDAHLQPDLFYRTTDEMLAEFSYLGEKAANEVVLENPLKIADMVLPDMKPFPDGSFPPIIASAADDIRRLTWDTANAIYGHNGNLPDEVRSRAERELDSIIENGFAIMYYIAHKLVKKSNDDGYIVGSRGSVGSSFVATLCGITEVNPLPPHHVCPECRYSIFDNSGEYGSGYDLPAADCPVCGTRMLREGQDIPFETFLGFNGDKQPDIDLNFSGEYQPRAHKFIEEMFGSSHTFRAGTIGSFADKNAQAIVRNYFEKQEAFATQAEITRLAKGLIGVKRTTGQHPGGIVVVPKERDIYDFTPIQYPADKRGGGTITTHFDFNAMHDTILKLDVLGHDDPTMLKMLGDMTGVDVNTIPIPDDKVMSLFTSTQALGIPDGKSPVDAATLGLPELGTFMARDMIKETRPTRFFDLVQLMGLSHGTDVWKGNAQELIRTGICSINEVIGCRDSIMTWLIHNKLPPKTAFDIMEKVRKGKGLSAEHEKMMRDHDIPEWYIESCKKIKYMFPKAHAAAYTISSLRIAWFKVYHPEAYYCAYFTVRADEFDSSIMCRPAAEIRIDRERRRHTFRESTDRDQKIYYIIELVEEMQLRGIDFLPLDLYRSDPVRFLMEETGKIRPPLNAIPGISAAIALNIAACVKDGPFKSRDELMRRAGIGQSALETLAMAGCLDGIPDSAQIDLFEIM
jgi:DNA polymerase-3 subunit alpha (Gram-positive type)